jgi:hypothetical protein
MVDTRRSICLSTWVTRLNKVQTRLALKIRCLPKYLYLITFPKIALRTIRNLMLLYNHQQWLLFLD